MTNEELAQLGYRPSMGSADLNAAQASVSPQDLQQFYAAAGNAAAPEMTVPGPRPQFNPAILTQLTGSTPSVDQQNMVNANQLQVMSSMVAVPQSDPNGLTSDQPQIVDAPGGGTMVLPPNTGAANTYGGTPVPETPPTASQTQQSESRAQPQNVTPNQNVATELGFPQFSDWAKASGLPRQVMPEERKIILEKYLDQQKDFMARQDPEKILKLQQMQHDISSQGMKDQNLQAQTAESQSKVISGELAKQQALDTVSNQIADLETQRDNLMTVAHHPELNAMTGVAGQYNPGLTGSQRDLKARLEQIGGQQLIGGINKIKDEAANPNGTLGLRITQQEALAVKNAVQRLQRYQDPTTFSNSAMEAAKFLDKGIAAKQAQLSRMPSVNQDLLKQFSYTPNGTASAAQAPTSMQTPAAPMIKTIPGKGTFQSLGNGQWKQIQ
jgi:hypothetical protein